MEVAVEINIGCCRLADNFWPGHLNKVKTWFNKTAVKIDFNLANPNMETFFTAIKCQANI